LSEELAQLGANLGTGSSLDGSSVTMSGIEGESRSFACLLADIILNPSFPKADFDRLQKTDHRRHTARKGAAGSNGDSAFCRNSSMVRGMRMHRRLPERELKNQLRN